MRLGGSLRRSRRGRGRRAGGSRAPAGRGGGRRGPGGGRTALVALGLAASGWGIGYLFSTRVVFPAPPPPGDLREVPDVRGLGPATARERLAGAGLDMASPEPLQHPTVPENVILGQAPLPGQLARPGTPVRVTVSLGPQRRAVPDVARLDAVRARTILEASGFLVAVDSVESPLPRGRVVQVDPSPDSVVALPAEVRLEVSAGPPVVVMPMVLGLERGDAVAALDSLGLIVGEVREVYRFGRDVGIVVEQEPAADTELERGSAVRLSVGGPSREGG